ncbi:GntR family transcriptional regulator [Hephaestia sp. GCM10023244]|uniref:GntR family transcriptional regulator n=1 Tax=unclassified Hephaestia TaxID=2631281 RepID=UPI0020770392|nr:GntR family transcriptional regulator [Hephaestia sp. MAHUQ-44]MCM8732400.1 GntR family transcriptional regulator [Hephaestia sp. MAHUQ-44]
MSMEPRRATAAEVYQSIKADILRGVFLAGERLDPRGLAEMTASSASTVHMVLGRLAVEHLLLSLPGEGFHMPFLNEAALRGTYRWMCKIAHVALDLAVEDPIDDARGSPPTIIVAKNDPDVLATEQFFACLAARTEIADVKFAMAQTNDRLHALRRLEKRLIPDGLSEIKAMSTLLAQEEHSALRSALEQYRDRRLAHVPELVRLRHRVRQ